MTETLSTRQKQIRVRLATSLGAAGLLALVLAAAVGSFPRQIGLWVLFAVGFTYFEWRAVEVNDRLLASPTVMVLLTAAVVFGKGYALLGVMAMTALGPLTPRDIRERRWFQPAVNFGMYLITAAVSISVLEWLLPPVITTAALWQVAVASAAAALLHGVINLRMVQIIVAAAYGRRELRPWSRMLALVAPYLGMGFLGGLLGAAYHLVGAVTLPLIFIVFFVGHLTFASYAELREAQESTLRGFVKALEAKDLYTRGHTERVAYFSQMIGEELGYNGTQLEKLRWAALIHDVGKLAVPRDLIKKKARLTDEEYRQMQTHVHLVEDLLAEVGFLEPMIRIASNHHAHYDGNGYHGPGHEHGETPGRDACILSVADAFDAMTSTRSYRAALSQGFAFAELRRCAGSQFDPVVVETFIATLERRGEVYGSPELADEAEARRIAEEHRVHHDG